MSLRTGSSRAADWPAGVQPIANPILCNEDGVRPYVITTRNIIGQDKITCGNLSNKPEGYLSAKQVLPLFFGI